MHPSQTQSAKTIHTIDLHFMGVPGAIAAYLIPHPSGAVLVECGPGSTIPALLEEMKRYGFTAGEVTDVFVTHIHLDHAGAAGWLARQGARVHVHPVGAPHLLDPERLLASAARIYGNMMNTLWGEVLSVPEDRLSVLQDGDQVEVEGMVLRALDTPGHANHHFAYLFEDVCFSGDICGVRLPGPRHLRLPMPPPEFHLGKWRESLDRLKQEKFTRLIPTHFGIYDDPDWHLSRLSRALDEVEAWMCEVMPADPPVESINDQFIAWTRRRSWEEGLDEEQMEAYETANPSWMSAHGMQRYWKKYIMGRGT